MQIDAMTHDDICCFLDLALEEGWLCDREEFSFLLSHFPQGCRVIRENGGEPLAFVSSIRYRRSGWVGNLIVRKESRRGGLGSTLMEEATKTLHDAGVRTIWLTASVQGAPLYSRMGFREIDRIIRMKREGKITVNSCSSSPETDFRELTRLDRLGWGDARTELLLDTAQSGRLNSKAGSAMVIRQIGSHSFIGPWVSDDIGAATDLIHSVEIHPDEKGPSYSDLPTTNTHARRLLESVGFAACSETVLMFQGDIPSFRAEIVYALASPGSIG